MDTVKSPPENQMRMGVSVYERKEEEEEKKN